MWCRISCDLSFLFYYTDLYIRSTDAQHSGTLRSCCKCVSGPPDPLHIFAGPGRCRVYHIIFPTFQISASCETLGSHTRVVACTAKSGYKVQPAEYRRCQPGQAVEGRCLGPRSWNILWQSDSVWCLDKAIYTVVLLKCYFLARASTHMIWRHSWIFNFDTILRSQNRDHGILAAKAERELFPTETRR